MVLAMAVAGRGAGTGDPAKLSCSDPLSYGRTFTLLQSG